MRKTISRTELLTSVNRNGLAKYLNLLRITISGVNYYRDNSEHTNTKTEEVIQNYVFFYSNFSEVRMKSCRPQMGWSACLNYY